VEAQDWVRIEGKPLKNIGKRKFTAGILRPESLTWWQVRVVKDWGDEKTIERFDWKRCRSSGLLMWLTFRSLIDLPRQNWKTG
jgi:hypothetical protein